MGDSDTNNGTGWYSIMAGSTPVITDEQLADLFFTINKRAVELQSARDVVQWLKVCLLDFVERHISITYLQEEDELYYYNHETKCWHDGAENIIGYIAEKASRHAMVHDLMTTRIVDEIVRHIKRSNMLSSRRFPNIEGVYALKNCYLNVFTHQATTPTQELFVRRRLPLVFNEKAECPRFDQFLNEVLATEEDKKAIYEMFGYCLLPRYPIHRAFLLVGDGANGKSTLLHVLRTFLGAENVSSVSLQDIGKNRFAAARLYGKLANIYADLDREAIKSTGIFKMLVGEDSMTADRKFRQPLQFVNTAKLIFSANQVPEVIYDDTTAYFRRWVIINFPNQFIGEKADVKLKGKLTIEEELSGILNKSLQALDELLKRGDFANARSTEEIREKYIMMSDSVGAFILAEIEDESGRLQYSDSSITKTRLYEMYCEFCRTRNLPPYSRNVFFQRLSQKLGGQIREERVREGDKRSRVIKGICIKEPVQTGLEG